MSMRKKKLSRQDQERLQSSIRVNMQQEDPRMYSTREKDRLSIGREGRTVLTLGIALILLFFFSLLCLLDLTFRGFSAAWILENMTIRANDLIHFFSGAHTEMGTKFLLSEFAAVMLCGGALSASGAIYQGVFHNPLASPTLLGVQSGGQLGQAIFSLYFIVPGALTVTSYEDRAAILAGQSIFEIYAGQLFVFAGCLLAVAVVVTVSRIAGKGKVNTVALLLAGTVFSGIVETIISVLKYTQSAYNPGSVAESAISSVQQTSFSSVSHPALLAMMAVPILLCMFLAILMRNRINLLAFGETEAKTIGVNTSRTRLFLIVISTIMTASVISFCGQIAFVGLIAAILARRLTGPDFRFLLPASILLGALMLLIAFDVTYMIGSIIDTSSVMSIIGGIFFMIIMTMNRRKRNASWA